MTRLQDTNEADLPSHGRTRAAWLKHLSDVGSGHGFFERVGADHMALFVEESETLLVSFDRAERVYAETRDGMPAGFEMVVRREWSFLSILSMGDTRFRDDDLSLMFETLLDNGVFDTFKRVFFLGLGPVCGHAACCYSSAAPGARVIASRPAARVDQGAGGNTRFADASALLSGSDAATILFDSKEAGAPENFARFSGSNVVRVDLPHCGAALETMIHEDDLAPPMFRALGNNRLDAARVREILRPSKRRNGSYLMRLAEAALNAGQTRRAATIARYALDATGEQRFRTLLSLTGEPIKDAATA